MKIGIIYYSRSGNTKKVANVLKDKIKDKKIDVETVEIKHDKKPGFFKAGRSAMTQKEQPINNKDFDLQEFDKILVGSPTWAGKPSPHIRSFFNKAENIKGKKAGIFYTASGKPDKANTGDDLKKYLSEIGLEPVDNIIGFQMKKEKIKDGKQKIDNFVETFMKK